VVVTMQFDFACEVGHLIGSLLLHMAQVECTQIRVRQAVETRAAQAAGKRWGGRRPGTRRADPARARELRRRGLSNSEIATALDVSTRTVTRMIHGTSNNHP